MTEVDFSTWNYTDAVTDTHVELRPCHPGRWEITIRDDDGCYLLVGWIDPRAGWAKTITRAEVMLGGGGTMGLRVGGVER